MKDVKIILACHKPFPESSYQKDYPDLFLPVLGGKGDFNQDVPFFYKNMVGDNTGDNISWLNPYLSEYTILYWVWKNYDKIGNPEYIGFNHYRRYFDPKDYLDKLEPNKVFLFLVMTKMSVLSQFYGCHEYVQNRSDDIVNYVFSDNPKYRYLFKVFMDGPMYAGCSMFVSHKSLFNEMMRYINKTIQYISTMIDFDTPSPNYVRYHAFLLERIFAFLIGVVSAELNLEIQPIKVRYLGDDGQDVDVYNTSSVS